MTDKQIIEYKHIKCTKDDCCHYCGSVFCGYVDDIENLEKAYKAKEQECEELKKIINEAKNSKLDLNSFFAIEATVGEYQLELDQLKAEVKSKTEYIQEQRDIINQYSKEIEMYKKCQGKRASKREEELKAENKHLNDLLNQALKELEKTRETLTEIKEHFDEECKLCKANYINITDKICEKCEYKQILQKISEVEDANI